MIQKTVNHHKNSKIDSNHLYHSRKYILDAGDDSMAKNPYSILFGKEPLENISRASQATEIIENFTEDQPTQQIYMITGIRGSGKTVFMTEVTRRFKKSDEWITVELSSDGDILEKLGAALASEDKLARIFQQANINLSLFGFGLEVNGIAPIASIEIAVAKMLESIKKHGKRVLITIDEVMSTPEMKTFSSAFQLYVRQDLPVYLLMTGLYENIEELQNEKNLTFLYRAPKIYLKPLNIQSIAENYRKVFGADRNLSMHMAKLTKGYPFAFQALGYLTWENGGRFDETIKPALRQFLEDYAYDIIWNRLSDKDKYVTYGIARTESGKILDIRRILGLETNQFNPYRKRLIRKGIITGDEWGYVKFTLPMFDEFVLFNYDGELIPPSADE